MVLSLSVTQAFYFFLRLNYFFPFFHFSNFLCMTHNNYVFRLDHSEKNTLIKSLFFPYEFIIIRLVTKPLISLYYFFYQCSKSILSLLLSILFRFSLSPLRFTDTLYVFLFLELCLIFCWCHMKETGAAILGFVSTHTKKLFEFFSGRNYVKIMIHHRKLSKQVILPPFVFWSLKKLWLPQQSCF